MPTFNPTPDQRAALRLLSSGARNILLFGGSRSGKTFVLVYAIIARAFKSPTSRHIILRHRFNAVKQSIGMDTLPKVMRLCFPNSRYQLNRTDWLFKLDNGAEIWLGGLDDKERVDQILGKEYATIYFNEASEISYHAVATAMSRLAQRCFQHCPGRPGSLLINKAFFDCNPPGRSHWSHQLFIEKIDPVSRNPLPVPSLYASMVMNPGGNAANLPEEYLSVTLANLPEHQRRRFLEGRWLDDAEGALWQHAVINRHRIVNPPELQRVVIGVDPAVSSGSDSDLTGIVAAGIDGKGHCHVLEDASIAKASPLQWARRVVALYHKHHADRVIGEVNNGGELVEANLRAVCPSMSYKAVRASRGKFTRAEPVAALYEQGKVHHVGSLPELEDQLCAYNPATSSFSPDRMDALVWAITELTGHAPGTRLISA